MLDITRTCTFRSYRSRLGEVTSIGGEETRKAVLKKEKKGSDDTKKGLNTGKKKKKKKKNSRLNQSDDPSSEKEHNPYPSVHESTRESVSTIGLVLDLDH